MVKVQNVSTIPAPAPIDQRKVEQEPTSASRQDPKVEAETAEKPAQESPTREELAETTSRLQLALDEARPQDWRVGIHEDEATGSLVIEIRDVQGEIIKQYPPEKVLNLQRKLADLAGVVIDETT